MLLLIGGSEALINQTIEQETAAAAAAAAASSSMTGATSSIGSSIGIGTGGNLGGAIMTDHCDLTDIRDGRGTLDDINSLTQLGHVNIFGSNTSEASQHLDHSLHHSHHHSHLHHSHGHHFHHHQLDSGQSTTGNIAPGHSLGQTANSVTNHPSSLLWQASLPETGDILNLEHSSHHVLDDVMDERGKLMLTSMLSMNQLSGYTTGTTTTESAGGSTVGSNACSSPPSHLMDLHHLHDLSHLGNCIHQSCPSHDDDLESSTGGSCSMQSNAPKVTLV